MNSEQFAYWMQGLFELGNPEQLTKEQTKMIKDHLALVFNKVTPNYDITFPTPNWECGPVKPKQEWFSGYQHLEYKDNTVYC